jgi:hypothetical protein
MYEYIPYSGTDPFKAVSKEALWRISKTLRVPLSQLVREV